MHSVNKGEMNIMTYGWSGDGSRGVNFDYAQMFKNHRKLMEQYLEKGYTKVVIDPPQMTTANRSAMIEWCKQNCEKEFSSFVVHYGYFFFESQQDAEFFALVW